LGSGFTGNLTFTPSSDFNGTISAVSVLPYKAAFNTVVAGGIPIPADAHGAGGTDREIQIYQPSTNSYWDFWQFQKDSYNGSWEACWGGVINNVSQSDGIFPNDTGSTATSLPLLGGIPRIEELQAGQINHAIGLTLMYNLISGVPANTPGATKPYSWPATRNDGGSTDSLAIPEGTRFRLNPNLDLSQYNLTPYAMAIAVAAQKYGFVVDDSSANPAIRIGDPTTYTVAGLSNPYTTGVGVGGLADGNKGLFDGVPQSQIMANFPWSQLQALPYNYGESGTTTTTTPSLNAPTGLGATAASSAAVNLSWTADSGGSGVTAYKIYRNGSSAALATVNAPSTTYTDSDVDPGTNYSYTVTAVDSSGTESSKSSSANATTSQPMDGSVALSLPSSGTPFASSSFWNTPLAASTPTNSNSSTYVSAIKNQLCSSGSTCNPDTENGVLQTTDYSDPVYVVPANQPKAPVQPYCSDGRSIGQSFITDVLDPGVPVPADAHGAAGTDGHVSIYQPSTNTLWEFWRFQKSSSGAWEACWGGLMNNVSGSSGVFTYPEGGWTTGLAQLGALVRIDELQSGQINHAIGIGLGDLLKNNVIPANTPGATSGISWPANRSDGTNTDATAIPEGTRFRLPANLNLSQYNLSPVAKAIAVAAQKYGLVVAWTSNTNVNLSLGDPTTYTTAGLPNPYTTGPGVGGVENGNKGLFGGVPQYQIMNNFPWSQLQALPFNYGEPDTTPPSVPTDLHSTSWTDSSVSLAWNASSDNTGGSGLAGYHVYRNGVLIASPSGTSYTDSGLTKGTLYSYNVSAYDKAGNGSDATATLALKPSSGPPTDGSVQLSLPTSGTPFAASSFWNTPLAASTPVNPNSQAYDSDIAADLCLHPVQSASTNPCEVPNYGSLNTTQYSAPLYIVPANQPRVTVTAACANPKPGTSYTPGQRFIDFLASNPVPVPADAHQAAGTDEEIQIYQPSTNTEWEFWQFQKDSSGNNWQACYGGVISNVTQSNGIVPSNFGATATSLPLLGGVVRIEELQAGQINHVMGLQLANNLSKTVLPANTSGATNGISWPATRTDGTNTSPTAIPEGTHLRIPASLDLSNYNPANPNATDKLSPTAYTILVAAQKYGFVVYDTDPNGVNIRLGDPTTYTAAGLPDPYSNGSGVGGVGSNGLFDGVAQSQIMKGFPWSQLQALPFNYGEPSSAAPAPDTTPPAVPTGLKTTATNPTSVSLSWSASTDNTGGSGLAGYHLYRNGALIASPTTASYVDSGLSPHTSYTYSVSAYDNAGNGSVASSALPVTTRYYGDFNGTGTVSILDLSILLSNYGKNYAPAEFDNHSTVDLQDLSILLSNYGK
jgi:chitodextrinase